MQLKRALDDKKLDVRIKDRLVAEGKLTYEEVKKNLETLKDEETNSEWLKNPSSND